MRIQALYLGCNVFRGAGDFKEAARCGRELLQILDATGTRYDLEKNNHRLLLARMLVRQLVRRALLGEPWIDVVARDLWRLRGPAFVVAYFLLSSCLPSLRSFSPSPHTIRCQEESHPPKAIAKRLRKEALEVFSEAIDGLRVTHGPDHETTRFAEAEMDSFRSG